MVHDSSSPRPGGWVGPNYRILPFRPSLVDICTWAANQGWDKGIAKINNPPWTAAGSRQSSLPRLQMSQDDCSRETINNNTGASVTCPNRRCRAPVDAPSAPKKLGRSPRVAWDDRLKVRDAILSSHQTSSTSEGACVTDNPSSSLPITACALFSAPRNDIYRSRRLVRRATKKGIQARTRRPASPGTAQESRILGWPSVSLLLMLRVTGGCSAPVHQHWIHNDNNGI
ncbi:uncharacterized protein EI97DRAFT_428086 [Westerdykella ornata]|uniref:Uncharacterized protein n=1 Tax=Westerdykella ornata TaxID=318751 RepID=A0A6A6J519_WESOR|nr:uncharacterized protein EI97DRAFT_428086 [Westerdykella ornata]KAF2271535.1 hypothetical protein EI97DRAFT_428086 [Westerdykella ornata]